MPQNQFKPVQPGQLSETLAQNEKGKGLGVVAQGRALVELVQGSEFSTGKKERGDRESASYPPGHPCLSVSHWGEALLRFRDALGVWRLPSLTGEGFPES